MSVTTDHADSSVTWKTFTVKFLNFQTPENFAVIYLKFKQRGQTLGYFIKQMQMESQTVKLKTLIRLLLEQTVKTLIRLLLEEQSDLGLHCLPRPIYPKIKDHYGIH